MANIINNKIWIIVQLSGCPTNQAIAYEWIITRMDSRCLLDSYTSAAIITASRLVNTLFKYSEQQHFHWAIIKGRKMLTMMMNKTRRASVEGRVRTPTCTIIYCNNNKHDRRLTYLLFTSARTEERKWRQQQQKKEHTTHRWLNTMRLRCAWTQMR